MHVLCTDIQVHFVHCTYAHICTYLTLHFNHVRWSTLSICDLAVVQRTFIPIAVVWEKLCIVAIIWKSRWYNMYSSDVDGISTCNLLHAHIHTLAHAHIHTHTHTRPHTYMYTLVCQRLTLCNLVSLGKQQPCTERWYSAMLGCVYMWFIR